MLLKFSFLKLVFFSLSLHRRVCATQSTPRLLVADVSLAKKSLGNCDVLLEAKNERLIVSFD